VLIHHCSQMDAACQRAHARNKRILAMQTNPIDSALEYIVGLQEQLESGPFFSDAIWKEELDAAGWAVAALQRLKRAMEDSATEQDNISSDDYMFEGRVTKCDNELDRPYVLHHHAVMQAAWDKVRNFESDSDREFNDQVWVRAKEEAAMSREEYDRQLDASHMATFE